MNMNTDDLEDRLFEDCHDKMKGKPVNTALFGTVQASARIFIALQTFGIAFESPIPLWTSPDRTENPRLPAGRPAVNRRANGPPIGVGMGPR